MIGDTVYLVLDPGKSGIPADYPTKEEADKNCPKNGEVVPAVVKEQGFRLI